MSIDMQKCSTDSECCVDMHVVSDGSNVCKSLTTGSGDSEKLMVTSLEIPDHVSCKIKCLTDQVDIEYVNGILLNRNYCHILEEFNCQQTDGRMSLLHITPRLSFLAIQAYKIGYHSVTMATLMEHYNIIHQVAVLNGCKAGQINLVELSDLNDLDFQVDMVISDLVESCGALRQQVLEELPLHKLTSLNSNGTVVPYQIKILEVFIESEELENRSHMTGNNKTLGFDIAEHINMFQAQNHLNIDMTTLTFDKLTDVMELFHIDLYNTTMSTTKDDLEQTVNVSTVVINSGKITALMYWFELLLSKDTTFSTLDSHFHWTQAGVMMEQDITAMAGQTLITKGTLHNSYLDLAILKPEYVNGTHS